MPESELRFVRRCAEFLDKVEVSRLKNGLRGIYVLYKEERHGRRKNSTMFNILVWLLVGLVSNRD